MNSSELKVKTDSAFTLHQQGKFLEAEKIYSEILALEPKNANVLNLYGLLLCQQQKYNDGIFYIEKAAIIAPSAYIYSNLGNIYSRINQFDKSIEVYQKGLELEDNNFNIIYSLAVIYEKKQNYEESINYYKLAIKLQPDNFELYSSVAVCLLFLNKDNDAIEHFKKAIGLNSNDYSSLVNLGNIYSNNSNYSEATKYYKQAILVDKNNHRAYLSLALAYLKMKDIVSAEKVIEVILKLEPNEAEIMLDLGLLYEDKKMKEKAFEVYNKILKYKPNSYKAYLNIAEHYIETKDYDKAIEACYKALEINPNYANAYLNLGSSYKSIKEYLNAIKCFEKALEIEPNHVNSHFNLGTTYLTLGQYDLGWFHYEWRLIKKNPNQPPLPKLKQDTWKGESLEGKTIYVCYEQGLGDVIQFSRYLNVLNSLGAKVLFKSQPGLEKLLKQSFTNIEIIDKYKSELELEFDYYLYLLSLPLYLSDKIVQIPQLEGYLKSDNELVKEYKEQYFDNDSFKVGICWQTSAKGTDLRGISLKHFYELARTKGIKLYSLQKGLGVEELNELPSDIEITDLGKSFNDFADTAAAIENLDLVISTDTSVAHLAGAIGKPVWTLLAYVASWRWLENRIDTDWYKSMQLFRQPKVDDWESVFIEVSKSLKNKIL